MLNEESFYDRLNSLNKNRQNRRVTLPLGKWYPRYISEPFRKILRRGKVKQRYKARMKLEDFSEPKQFK